MPAAPPDEADAPPLPAFDTTPPAPPLPALEAAPPVPPLFMPSGTSAMPPSSSEPDPPVPKLGGTNGSNGTTQTLSHALCAAIQFGSSSATYAPPLPVVDPAPPAPSMTAVMPPVPLGGCSGQNGGQYGSI